MAIERLLTIDTQEILRRKTDIALQELSDRTTTGPLTIVGTITAGTLNAVDGWSGTFTNGDGNTVTVVDGIVTNVA